MRRFTATATILTIALALGGAAGTARACSQCMCGMPFPSGVLGGVVPMQISWGLDERYLSKTNALDEGSGMEDEREHRVAGYVLWRPHNHLALLGRVPYNFKEIETRPDGGASSVERQNGLGDVELFAMLGLYQSAGHAPVALGLIAGVAAPTGTIDAKDASGERLDAHLQPGSGAWSGTGGLHVALGATGAWEAGVMGRVNSTNAHDYRYGNTLLYNAGYRSREWKGVRLLAQVNGRSAERDQLENGTIGEHTGGTVVYAAPGLRWITGVGLTVEGLVQVPFIENLYGIQDEHTTGRLTVSYTR
jgi:hypothetical protein